MLFLLEDITLGFFIILPLGEKLFIWFKASFFYMILICFFAEESYWVVIGRVFFSEGVPLMSCC